MRILKLVAFSAAALAVGASAHAADGAASGPAAIQKDKAAKPAAAKPASGTGAVRNWAEIDTNKDGLISPEEMEAYLKANPGPQRGD